VRDFSFPADDDSMTEDTFKAQDKKTCSNGRNNVAISSGDRLSFRAQHSKFRFAACVVSLKYAVRSPYSSVTIRLYCQLNSHSSVQY
jgi:hypothetical protein